MKQNNFILLFLQIGICIQVINLVNNFTMQSFIILVSLLVIQKVIGTLIKIIVIEQMQRQTDQMLEKLLKAKKP